jgi:hypothetical protein
VMIARFIIKYAAIDQKSIFSSLPISMTYQKHFIGTTNTRLSTLTSGPCLFCSPPNTICREIVLTLYKRRKIISYILHHSP